MPRRSSTPAVSSAALNTLTLGTLTRIVPRATVAQVLRRHQRMHKIHCTLPAPFLVYFVIALGLQMALPTRAVLRWLQQGMRALWGAAAAPAASAAASPNTPPGHRVDASDKNLITHPRCSTVRRKTVEAGTFERY